MISLSSFILIYFQDKLLPDALDMDSDLLSVPSSTLSLEVNDEEQSESGGVGLHVLTTETINGTDTIIGQLNEESSNSTIAIPSLPSEITAPDIDKDGEITLQSSLIPENAVLMETPRGSVAKLNVTNFLNKSVANFYLVNSVMK